MSRKKDTAEIEMDRAEFTTAFLDARSLDTLCRVLHVNDEDLAAHCRKVGRRTRQGRIDEALSLLAVGVCSRAAATFTRCPIAVLLEARDKGAEMAPPLTAADRAADAQHIAKWGYV